MIRTVRVTNFKSIPDLTLELGRVTVLIGANGSGKSNVLEAIALASAAGQSKLDNEFLTSRGVRVTETQFMKSAFQNVPATRAIQLSFDDKVVSNVEAIPHPNDSIRIKVSDESKKVNYELRVDESGSYPKWTAFSPMTAGDLLESIEKSALDNEVDVTREVLQELVRSFWARIREHELLTLKDFLVYTPENTALRSFQSEAQILPLGIHGEGLFSHLKSLSGERYRGLLIEIKASLKLIDWYETFNIPDDLSPGERSIRIQDRFLPETAQFDQRSANEGFLFLLFYVTLFVSPDTPKFFAIDNIDSSLNPKLCVALLKQIVELAKKYDKQVILTTHNPAVLDGLDLKDDEQRLLVVERNMEGHTRVRRVPEPKPTPGYPPVALSEAFLRGYIGGLPESF